jgi:FMN phosphatase YigB (HAD superfamily)
MFTKALADLRIAPAAAVMVGDRPAHDGAAVNTGIPVLLPPPLQHPGHRRLDLVLRLAASPAPA